MTSVRRRVTSKPPEYCSHCLGRGTFVIPAKRVDSFDRFTGFCPHCYGFDQPVHHESLAERRERRRRMGAPQRRAPRAARR